MNREFFEETGSEGQFSDRDFLFCYATFDPTRNKSRVSHIYAKICCNYREFNDILVNFHMRHTREAYINEVLGLIGYPVWIEGPENMADVSWSNNIWGLPRHWSGNDGFLSSTLANSSTVLEQFILILVCKKILDVKILKRVFALSKHLSESSLSIDDYLSRPGLLDVMAFHQVLEDKPNR